ncbi:hypothetical protein [Acinetobacter sp. MD2(2019)]|uniref:hypothetical protein n=1 Tax=Acinetobacter sp. MD2(2019) TaxID=2605273 RepID=UPI002D1ED13B|nr:hypothetical protein [Acinetobacter sp. MD2(2019)]MEB3753212.1 hypothetical protein [Acinetobacter sp. MD2(2019)]
MRNQTKTKFQQWLLLTVGIISLFFAWVFWLITDIRPLKNQDDAVEQNTQPQFQVEQVTATPNLGVMTDEVRPLQQTTRVVVAGNHGHEFRGTKFILANQDRYSIELIQVTKEDIIRNFLAQHANHNAFMYFRLAQPNQPEHYVLNYGLFSSRQAAENQLHQLDLSLPVSVRPKVVALKEYLSSVNDIGMDEKDTQSVYAVNLKAVPVAALPPAPTAPEPTAVTAQPPKTSATTSTTITQKDAAGNVVKQEQTHSNVSHAASNPALKTP